jgi:hypothetical protein
MAVYSALLALSAMHGIIGTTAAPTAPARCQWVDLINFTNEYIDAQTSGQPYESFLAPNTPGLTYRENNKVMNISSGILSQPVTMDFYRTMIDQTTCSTYIEIVSVSGTKPWVIGTQLHLSDTLEINLIDIIATTTGDWLFNASATLMHSEAEKWTTISTDDQDTRDTIQAAADAYLDMWDHNNTVNAVPWGTPCDRLEGGAYTGTGLANDTCKVGIPDGTMPPNTDRRYVIDETLGSISVFSTFNSMGGAADSHQFRLEGGKLRYVHTMTVTRKS